MHDGGSVKSYPACIEVYKTQRPAFVLIGENIQPYTVILKTVFYPRYLTCLYKIVALIYHANVHINTKLLCTVCLNPDPNNLGLSELRCTMF